MSGAVRLGDAKASKTDNLFKGLSTLREEERKKVAAVAPKKVNSALDVSVHSFLDVAIPLWGSVCLSNPNENPVCSFPKEEGGIPDLIQLGPFGSPCMHACMHACPSMCMMC